MSGMLLIIMTLLNSFQSPFPVVWDTLDNGLIVGVAQRKTLPIFQVYIAIKAGAIYDPQGKEGTANLVARMLDKGSEGLSAREIAERIEGVGGSLSISAHSYTTTISLRTLTDVMDMGLQVLQKVLLNPTFPEEFLEKEKQRVISGIEEDKSDPNSVLENTFRKEVYGDHPLGRPVEGTEETIKEITQEDLINFYSKYYAPNNAVCAVVTDLPPEEALTKIKDVLNGWEKKEVNFPEIPEPEPIRGKRVIFVNMDVNQAFLEMGNIAIKRSNPDYAALRAFNYILGGGGFVSRLVKEVRNKAGYAYDVHSYFEPGLYFPGPFVVGTETKIETANDAIKRILEVLKQTVNEGVTEDELKDTKAFYLGAIPRQTETYGQVAYALVHKVLFDLPDFYWLKDVEKIQKLTLEEANRAGRKYIDPENWVMVVVANVDSLKLEIPGVPSDSIILRTVK